MNESGKTIAVDIGASYIRIALFSKNLLLKFKKFKTPFEAESGEIISSKISDMIYSNFSCEDLNSVSSIGVSSAGPLDIQKGEIINSPNMNFSKIRIKKPLENEFQKEVKLINDCHAGVLGELSVDTSLKDKNTVYITISSGIGTGAYIDGNLILGKNGNAGELGHLFVDSDYSLSCRCGGFGHWEAYCSGNGMPAFFKEFCRKKKYSVNCADKITSKIIFENAKNDLILYKNFIDEIGKINSRGISGVIAAYSPDIIILDGSVAINNSNAILDGINQYTDRYLEMPEIRMSRLNGRAPLYGAAYYTGYLK